MMKYLVSINSEDCYLSRSEMEQFQFECPACNVTVNILEFSEHLKKDMDNIKNKFYPR